LTTLASNQKDAVCDTSLRFVTRELGQFWDSQRGGVEGHSTWATNLIRFEESALSKAFDQIMNADTILIAR